MITIVCIYCFDRCCSASVLTQIRVIQGDACINPLFSGDHSITCMGPRGTPSSTYYRHINICHYMHKMWNFKNNWFENKNGISSKGMESGGGSLTVTDRLTGRRTILLWTNSIGQWSVARSDGPSPPKETPPRIHIQEGWLVHIVSVWRV